MQTRAMLATVLETLDALDRPATMFAVLGQLETRASSGNLDAWRKRHDEVRAAFTEAQERGWLALVPRGREDLSDSYELTSLGRAQVDAELTRPLPRIPAAPVPVPRSPHGRSWVRRPRTGAPTA
ncbi:hypothetical protein [Blastococcus sp. SYSU D00820]